MHFFDIERSRVSNANTSRHFRSLEFANNACIASLKRVEPHYSVGSGYFPNRFENTVKKNRKLFLELLRPDVVRRAYGFRVEYTTTCSRDAIVAMLAWLSFLMLGNAILHVGATAVLGRYSPGVITSLVLYLLFSFLFLGQALREFRIGFVRAAAAIVVGAFPMLLHGYLIVFCGSRLF